MPMDAKVRLGRISYLNVLPIYYALEQVFSENGFHLERGTPAELNARMRRGEIDLGSISAMEYGRGASEYLLLPDLSISSRGPVKSVLLFSRAPFRELDGRPVVLSSASASGAALIKVLLAKLFGVKPQYRTGILEKETLEQAAAVLAIGDEALHLKRAGFRPYELDLGEAWQELTGLPFVFGVWAVRRSFAASEPETAATLHRLLLRSKDWGLAALPELSRLAAPPFGMSAEEILEYFRRLDYSFGPEHQQGLSSFFGYLAELEELPQAPQLEFFE
jgi:chorismate dehydratase